MSNLSAIPTDVLRAEIARREAEVRQHQESLRRSREVVIVCPTCLGARQVERREPFSGMVVGETCDLCGGRGEIKAVLAWM